MRFWLTRPDTAARRGRVAVVGDLSPGSRIESEARAPPTSSPRLLADGPGFRSHVAGAAELVTSFLRKPNDKKLGEHNVVCRGCGSNPADRTPRPGSCPMAIRCGRPRDQARSQQLRRGFPMLLRQKLLGFNENDGLQGKLRTAVHSVEQELKKHDQPRLSILMLAMRRHERISCCAARRNTAISWRSASRNFRMT